MADYITANDVDCITTLDDPFDINFGSADTYLAGSLFPPTARQTSPRTERWDLSGHTAAKRRFLSPCLANDSKMIHSQTAWTEMHRQGFR